MKVITKIITTVLGIIAFIVLLIVINNINISCNENYELINVTIEEENNKYCGYIPLVADNCNKNEILFESKCLIKPDGFFETKTGLYILFGLGILSIISLLLIVFIRIQTKGKKEIKEVKPIDIDVAIEIIKENWIKKNLIPYHQIGKKIYIPNNLINFYSKQQAFIKNNEWFLQVQCEILSGEQQGVFTIIVNLSKGEDYIRNGNYFYENKGFDNIQLKENIKPLNTPKDEKEKLFDRLASYQPELAYQYAEQYSKKLQEQELQKALNTDIPEQKIKEPEEQLSLQQQQYYSPKRRFKKWR